MALVLALQSLAFALALPTWIPSWQVAAAAAIDCLYAIAWTVALSAAWSWSGRRLTFILSALSLTGWLVTGYVVTALMVARGPFPSPLAREIRYPDGVAVYVYDASFLDPETEVRVGHPWLPATRTVTHLSTAHGDVEIGRAGPLLGVVGRGETVCYDLRDGRVHHGTATSERLYPPAM